MTYRIQTFITLVMASLIAVVGVSILFQNAQRQESFSLIRASESFELQQTNQKITELTSRQTYTLSYDYSYWDETVDFVQSGDSMWAHENLDVSLATYATDVIWIIRPSGEIVYAISGDSSLNLSKFPLIPMQAEWDRVAPLFMHFFVKYPEEILEVFTAPIQPSNDDARATPAHGLLAAGRFWSESYFQGMAELTGYRTRLFDGFSTDPDSIIAALEPTVVACIDTIRNHGGDPIALLLTERDSPLLEELFENLQTENVSRPIYGFVLILALFLVLHFWVSRPLALLSSTLTLERPEQLDKLRRGKTEFSDLARLIVRFFDQRDQLQLEIKDRERAEIALQDNVRTLAIAEERYRRLIEMSPDAILVSQKGIIKFANESAADLLKHKSPAELVNKPILSFVRSDFHEHVKERIATMETTGAHAPLTVFKCLAADNSALDIEVISTPIIIQDEPAFLTIARDITQRLAAEKENQLLKSQLEVAQRMESLAVLAGGVAHDLNNMLGPLVAYPELILLDLPDDSPAKPSVQAMEKAAMQAVDVIQDLLALARRGRYEMTSLCLDDVVRSYFASPNFEHLKSRNPEVVVESIHEGNPKAILGSSHHLQKVVMNLVVNAFDAIKVKSGRITISTSSRLLDRLDSGYAGISAGEYVILSVSDTGIGISAQDRPKIFEPYFSKKTMGASGSGLGLAVVYGILKDHRGFYDLISEPGKGSTFILYFPVTDKEVALHTDDKQVFPGHERILIIDDVPEQRAVASALLSSLGYKTHSVASGREALEHLREQSYDLLVIDMILEDVMDGLDTYKAVLLEHPNQKAIIVSGFSETDRVKEMLRIGAGGYVKKPYSRTSLSRAVRQSLNGNRRELTIV